MTGEDTQLDDYLNTINAFEFEELIADLWNEEGWDTSVTSGTKDRGIDVIAERNNPIQQKYVIQVKAYSQDNNIGSGELRNYATLFQQENDIDGVVIVTTGWFTDQAENLAEDLGIKIIDRAELVKLLSGTQTKDQYMQSSSAQEITGVEAEAGEKIDNSNVGNWLEQYRENVLNDDHEYNVLVIHFPSGNSDASYSFLDGQHHVDVTNEQMKDSVGRVIGKFDLEIVDVTEIPNSVDPKLTKFSLHHQDVSTDWGEFDVNKNTIIMEEILYQVFNINSGDEIEFEINPLNE